MTACLRVLVVDDNPGIVSTLIALLRMEGYEVRGHRSGAAAVASLRGGFKPDVVISDLAMPKVNGWALAKEVRRRMGEHPLLIALTGQYTKSTDKMVSHTSGFDHYLTKPADPNVLLALVAKASEKQRPSA